MITILFIGDVVGEPGRTAVKHMLPELKKEHGADFVIVNGENAAAGRGITPRLAQELLHAGGDVITTGDHVWDRRNWLLGWTPNRACYAPSTTRRGHRDTEAWWWKRPGEK